MAIHTTMRGFSKRMTEIAVGVEDESKSVLRKTVLTVVSAVVLRTPVDTGRARANWQVKIGTEPTGTVSSFAQGSKGSSGGAAVAQAIASAQSEVARLDATDTEVNIANNLDYIGRLNDGSSKQAPAGFVQSAIIAGVNAVRKSRLIK